MSVAGVVMAHPKRRAWAEELSAELELPIVWDRVNDRHETGLRCLEAGIGSDATHWLILQDDAVVCRDLIAGIEAAVAISGPRVVGLYVGNTRPQTGRVERLIASVRANGSSWLKAPGPWWGVGIVIPVPYLPDLVDRFASSTEENYDRRIEKWVERTGVGCWYTVPSLVDHRHGEENPSLVAGRGADGRRARYFIGTDKSALSIDWTRAPFNGELWRNLRTGQTRNVRSDSMHARRFGRSADWERVPAYPEGVPTKTCLVCGTRNCACGPKTVVLPIDLPERIAKMPKMGPLRRYENPNRPGSFLKLNDRDAARLGLLKVVAPELEPDPVLEETPTPAAEETLPPPAEPAPTPSTPAVEDPKHKARPTPASTAPRRRRVKPASA